MHEIRVCLFHSGAAACSAVQSANGCVVEAVVPRIWSVNNQLPLNFLVQKHFGTYTQGPLATNFLQITDFPCSPKTTLGPYLPVITTIYPVVLSTGQFRSDGAVRERLAARLCRWPHAVWERCCVHHLNRSATLALPLHPPRMMLARKHVYLSVNALL